MLYSYSLPLVLLLWGGGVSQLLPDADKPPTCAWDSEPCLLKDIMMMTRTSLSPVFLGSPSVCFLVSPDLISHSCSHSSLSSFTAQILELSTGSQLLTSLPNLFKSGSAQTFLPWPLCCQIKCWSFYLCLT